MTDSRKLFLYGEPDMPKIKEAKASMNLGFLVVPVFIERNGERYFGQGMPRILAWDAEPPFICDYAPVSSKTSSEGLVAALKWCLLGTDDPRAVTLEKNLGRYIPGVWELTPDGMSAYNGQEALRKISTNLKFVEKGDSRDY